MVENCTFFLRGGKSIVKGKRKEKSFYCRHLLRKTNLGKVEDLKIKFLCLPGARAVWREVIFLNSKPAGSAVRKEGVVFFNGRPRRGWNAVA